MAAFENLHFMRPEMLWALLPLAVLLAFAWRTGGNTEAWHKLIDAELMPFLLTGKAAKTGKLAFYVLVVSWLLACIAMAGPSWQKLPTAVYEKDDVLVIILDNTPSMLAQDNKPSRATHAAREISDILSQRNEGQTALITYSEDAFVVSPLTRDSNTIALLAESLSPEVMPAIGNRPLAAIELAIELVRNHPTPRILWLSDEVPEADSGAIIAAINASNASLSIMGIGTSSGAPIPLPNGNGFVKDSKGGLVVPRLNRGEFQRIAQATNGKYSDSLITDADINYLLDQNSVNTDAASEISDMTFDQWRDESWLIALLLLIPAALAFRQGNLLIALIALAPLLHSPSAHANWFNDLWQTKDQQAQQAFNKGDTKTAEALFDTPQWRASAAYKNGNYEAAITQYQPAETASDWYNLGNAYAKNNNFKEAIAAYEQALQLDPNLEDAQANKQLLEQLQQQQQEQQQNGEPQDQQDQSPEDQNQQGEQQQGSDQQQEGEQQPSSQGSNDQQSQNQQNQDEQKNADNEPQAPDQNAEQSDEAGDEKQDDAEQARPNEGEREGEQNGEVAAAEDNSDEADPRQALPAQLRNIDDDPGGLLKRKFADQAQSRQRQRTSTGEQRW